VSKKDGSFSATWVNDADKEFDGWEEDLANCLADAKKKHLSLDEYSTTQSSIQVYPDGQSRWKKNIQQRLDLNKEGAASDIKWQHNDPIGDSAPCRTYGLCTCGQPSSDSSASLSPPPSKKRKKALRRKESKGERPKEETAKGNPATDKKTSLGSAKELEEQPTGGGERQPPAREAQAEEPAVEDSDSTPTNKVWAPSDDEETAATGVAKTSGESGSEDHSSDDDDADNDNDDADRGELDQQPGSPKDRSDIGDSEEEGAAVTAGGSQDPIAEAQEHSRLLPGSS
jgi:hypothetical protein